MHYSSRKFDVNYTPKIQCLTEMQHNEIFENGEGAVIFEIEEFDFCPDRYVKLTNAAQDVMPPDNGTISIFSTSAPVAIHQTEEQRTHCRTTGEAFLTVETTDALAQTTTDATVLLSNSSEDTPTACVLRTAYWGDINLDGLDDITVYLDADNATLHPSGLTSTQSESYVLFLTDHETELTPHYVYSREADFMCDYSPICPAHTLDEHGQPLQADRFTIHVKATIIPKEEDEAIPPQETAQGCSVSPRDIGRPHSGGFFRSLLNFLGAPPPYILR